MSELKEVFLKNAAYNLTTRETEFLNVSSASTLTYTIKCSEDCEYGFRWAINSEFDVIEEVNYSLYGGDVATVYTPVRARYCQFYVKNIYATPCNLQTCAFFFDQLLGLEHLQNIGSFAQLFNSPNELRTLQSSDNSITITQNGDNIDFVSAGGGSNWELQGTNILKQKNHATVNNFLWQNGSVSPNQLLTTFNPTNSMILGGIDSYIKAEDNNIIIGGTSAQISRPHSSTTAICKGNVLINADYARIMSRSFIGDTSITRRNTVIQAYNGLLTADDNSTVEDCGIFGGSDCSIGGVNTNAHISISNIYGGYYSSIYAGGVAPVSIYNTIVGGRFGQILDACENSTIIGGRWLIVPGYSGCVMTGDNSDAVAALEATANNQYTARFAGGYRLFTDTESTTGMTMASGASSWTAVSDRNKKDIHGEVDYDDYLNKLENIPVYEYNFKGCCKEQRCIGLMAQDYNSFFGCDEIECEIVENIKVGEKVLTRGKDKEDHKEECKRPIYEQVKKKVKRPAKDPLGIDQGDLLGIAIACIKALDKQVKELTQRVIELESKII